MQVVYDEPTLDALNWTASKRCELTRELAPQAPLSLNPMRITVDGVPIDDPERSSADIQRCTDVALDGCRRSRSDTTTSTSERRLSL